MAGQHMQAEGDGADNDIGDGRRGCRGIPLPGGWGGVPPSLFFYFYFFNNQFDHRQKQRQPGHGGDDHGEDHPHHEEGAEGVGDGRHERPEAAYADGAGKDVHEEAGQEELEDGEIAVGAGDGHDVEEDAEGIEGGVLAGGQEGHAGEDIGIPEGELAGLDALHDEALPGVVLQDEVAEELVVGHGDAELVGEGAPGLEGEEVVGGQQRLAAEDDRPEEEEGEYEQAEYGQQRLESVFNHLR